MGFSLTGTHVIFFIASIIIAGVVSGVFIAVTTDVTNSFSLRGEKFKERLEVDYKIINDPENIPLSGNFYLFYLKNIGDRQIITTNNTLLIQIDGELIKPENYSFSPSVIQPDQVTILSIDNSDIPSGYHKLRVIGPQDINDEFIFTT